MHFCFNQRFLRNVSVAGIYTNLRLKEGLVPLAPLKWGLPRADNAATMLHIDISEGHSIRER